MTADIAARIQLLVVDDHTLFRRGLKALLSQDERFEAAREAADVGEALRSVAQHRPDVILLDNHLPGVRGIEAIPALKDAAPGSRILMLTVSENEEDLAAALQAGADGYLLKTVESDQLCDAIIKVLEGESVVSPEMMTKLFKAFRSQGSSSAPAPLPSSTTPGTSTAPASPAPDSGRDGVGSTEREGIALLSVRERQILALIARGDSNKLIARELDIAETTVKIHVQHILRKLDLTSRVQAAVFAVHHQLRG
jgi:two-component system, NarL family, nitrate/nitrite response regulator NarL